MKKSKYPLAERFLGEAGVSDFVVPGRARLCLHKEADRQWAKLTDQEKESLLTTMELVITDPVFEGSVDYLPNSRVLKGEKIMLNEQETKLLFFTRLQSVGSHKWFILQTILDAHAEIRMSL